MTLSVSTPSLAIQMMVVSMITQDRNVQHNSIDNSNDIRKAYDYIVVGGGTAGCVVARRLSDDPGVSVLLLEAGGPQIFKSDIPGMLGRLLREEPSLDWKYEIAPQKRIGQGRARPGVYSEPKGRVLGGSSTVNGMVYLRGNPRDYDNWRKKYGAKGWAFEEVLPYFVVSENNSDSNIVAANPRYHGTDGLFGVSSDPNLNILLKNVQQGYNQFGIPTTDHNGPRQTGTAFVQLNMKNGFRESTANAYLEPNPNPQNLFISLNSFVTKLRFSKINGKLTASGVQFNRSNTNFNVKARKEVILCAGSYASPQLLMVSGVGPKRHLNKLRIPVLANLPVGNNLQEHVKVNFWSTIANNTPLEPRAELRTPQLYQLITRQQGPLATFTGLYTYFSTKWNSDPNWPNTVISNRIRVFNNNISEIIAPYSKLRANEWSNFFKPYLGNTYLSSDIFLRRPRSVGSVRLRSRNPYVYPIIDPNFLKNPKDIDDMVEAAKFELYFLQNSIISRNVKLMQKPIPGCRLCPDRPIHECDSYIRCHIKQIGDKEHHSGGTCRMGSAKRKDTVVDPRLRVKFISRLRVCDASVIPRLPNSNTMAPTIMIGEKCAHYIQQENK